MSEFLDELARSLTTAMPRRKAVRVLGGALLGLAIPAAGARAARATHDCPAQNAFLCKCPSINGLFFRICCPNQTPKVRYKCTCKAPPNGYAECTKIIRCLQSASEACGDRCCAEGEDCCTWTSDDPDDFPARKRKCYDPETECCTPSGVQPKKPIKDPLLCPQRKGKDHEPTVNGCGPEDGVKAPDHPPGGANFREPCDSHDRCYETCRRSKTSCDSNFHTQMRMRCVQSFEPGVRRELCFTVAEKYYNAVKSKGLPAYKNGQRKACESCC